MKKTFLIITAFALYMPSVFCAGAKRTEREEILTTDDGWKINCSYLAPKADNPAIVLLHSLDADKNDWAPALKRIADLDYGYIAVDFRGHGKSIYKVDGSSQTYKTFQRAGLDNQYNQMANDVSAVIKFLEGKRIKQDKIILAGLGLGANVAIQAAAKKENKDISMMALFIPTLNANRDVMSVSPLRNYGKRPVFIATSADVAKIMTESKLLRGVAQLQAGNDMVTYATEYKGGSAELLHTPAFDKFIQWLKTPVMPEETDVTSEDEKDDRPDISADILDDSAQNENLYDDSEKQELLD